MCVSPNSILNRADTGVTLVACRYCWQCKENRINDWVGRGIAESKQADHSVSVTLTYGGGDENPHAKLLVYRDIQLFLKRLRKDGFDVRYMCAGEFGSDKGRAHWHLILFFKGAMPKVEYGKRFTWKYWDHGLASGWAFIEKPSYHAFRYVLKYTLKDTTKGTAVAHFSASKKPPLGENYFKQLAADYVKAGLAPKSYKYSFSEVTDREGKLREFMLQGTMRDHFMQHFLDLWSLDRPNKPLPWSDILDEYQDKLVAQELDEDVQTWYAAYKAGDFDPSTPWQADYTKKKGYAVLRSKSYGTHTIVRYPHGWHYIKKGQDLWQPKIETIKEMRLAILGGLPLSKTRGD